MGYQSNDRATKNFTYGCRGQLRDEAICRTLYSTLAQKLRAIGMVSYMMAFTHVV